MPTSEVFERHAERCFALAERTKEPNVRDLLLKTAQDWMRGAEALRRAASGGSAPPRADDGVPDDKYAA